MVTDYTSALAVQGAATFTVGQAAGSGSYTTGAESQTLPDSATYYWRVRTLDNGSYSSAYSTANSGAIAFKVDATAPTTGSVSVDATSAASLTASISGASDAGSGLSTTPYIFYNSTASTNSGATSSTSWLSTGLIPNTGYSFYAAVSNLAGSSANTATVAKYTLANIPTGLIITVDSGTQVTAAWSANSNPDGTEYQVTNETTATNSGWITTTSSVFSSLTCGTTYSFTVKARNTDNVETASTTSVSAATSACAVVTPPASGGSGSGSSSGNGGGGGATPAGVLINGGATTTTSSITHISMYAPFDAKTMAVSNRPLSKVL